MLKVAVAGSTGFLGLHLQEYFRNHTDIQLESINLRDGDLTAFNNCRIIINLVGKAHDHKRESTETEFYDVNLGLTKLLFQEFLKSNADHFIHISSIAAVEELQSTAAITEDCISNPLSIYGKSKRKAEEYLIAQELPSNKKLLIIRPTMIHGPGDKGSLTLLHKFFSKNIPYPFGAFHNQRSFLSIDNFCYLMGEICLKRDLIAGGIYNFADDTPLSTQQIIKTISRLENKKLTILTIPKTLVRLLAKIGSLLKLPLNNTTLTKMTSDLLVSNQKIKRSLSISDLPISSQEGLERTIKSFK